MTGKVGSWQRNPALAWREIDDETVIISPSESVMHELNDTGSFIWDQIDGHRTTADLAAMVAARYEVEMNVALADTETLLQQLLSKGLVLLIAASAGGDQR